MNNLNNSPEENKPAPEAIAADFAAREIKLAALMGHVPNYTGIPQALKDISNWVGWGGKTAIAGRVAEDKAETDAEVLEAKLRGVKIPVNPSTRGKAMPNNGKTWSAFNKARKLIDEGECVGVGFAFDGKPIEKDLCYVGIDLDNCVVDGEPTPAALDIIKQVEGYTEFSPSGNGIHIICLANDVGTGKKSNVNGCTVEVYSQGRYFTMSGNVLPGFSKLRASPEAVARLIIPERAQTPSRTPAESLGPLPAEFTASPLLNGAVAITNNALSAGVALPGQVAPDVAEVRSALAAIPKAEWDESEPWNAIARALAFESHHHPALKEELYAAFDEACGGVKKYNKENNRDLFDRFVREVPGYTGTPCTKATIFFEAGKHDWKGVAAQTVAQGAGAGAGAGDAGTGAEPGTGPALTGETLPFQYEKGSRRPKSNWFNAKLCLQGMRVRVWRDLFGHKIRIEGEIIPKDYVGSRSDEVVTWLHAEIFRRYGFDCDKKYIFDATDTLGEDNRKNPVTDGLDSLSWDGVKKIDTWLPRVTGCDDTPLHREFGKKFLLAMCIRARFPGTKYDTVLVLEGDQGIGKSLLARVLAGGGDYFTDAGNLISMPAKERGELLAGCWVAELPELGGLNRSQVETVKQAISQQSDHYRGAYRHDPKKQPRTCVFLATTNNTEYLEDATGARRFECVRCCVQFKKIKLDLLEAEREQLFAEANDVVNRAVALAARYGYHCTPGQELPREVLRLLTLPEHLWVASAAASEKRRVIAHGEEILADWEQRYLVNPNAQKNPINQKFFASSGTLRDEFRSQGWTTPVPPKSIIEWMRKLGWERTRIWVAAPKVAGTGVQQRGFEKI